MACENTNQTDESLDAVTRVSSGGESISRDINLIKAAQRYQRSMDKANIANRRVRKTFGTIVGATPTGHGIHPTGIFKQAK